MKNESKGISLKDYRSYLHFVYFSRQALFLFGLTGITLIQCASIETYPVYPFEHAVDDVTMSEHKSQRGARSGVVISDQVSYF